MSREEFSLQHTVQEMTELLVGKGCGQSAQAPAPSQVWQSEATVEMWTGSRVSV